MDPIYDIVPFRERRYEEIPIDKVKVINSRNRDQEQFDMNVEQADHPEIFWAGDSLECADNRRGLGPV